MGTDVPGKHKDISTAFRRIACLIFSAFIFLKICTHLSETGAVFIPLFQALLLHNEFGQAAWPFLCA
jgi:hypothetical protein